MADEKRTQLSPEDVLRIEAEAQLQTARLVAESKHRLVDRCPECGALGSLELYEGVTRCVDCDEVVGAKTSLGGMGRA